MIYVWDHLRWRRRLDRERSNIECIVLELDLLNLKHLIIFCYRPPTQSPIVFFETLSSVLIVAESESNSVITVLGDFNAKHLSWDTFSQPNIAGNLLADIFLDFGLTQETSAPTRFSSDCTSKRVLVQWTCLLQEDQTW